MSITFSGESAACSAKSFSRSVQKSGAPSRQICALAARQRTPEGSTARGGMAGLQAASSGNWRASSDSLPSGRRFFMRESTSTRDLQWGHRLSVHSTIFTGAFSGP